MNFDFDDIKIEGNIADGKILHFSKDKKKQLKIGINSSGGSGETAIGMFDMITRRARTQHVITVGIGTVESAAMWPFLAGTERWSYKNTAFMFHDPTMGNQISCHQYLKTFKFRWKTIFTPCIRRAWKLSNKSMDYWEDLFSGESTYLTAREMKKLNLVTKIIS